MNEQDIERLMDEYRANVRTLFNNKSSDIVNNSSYRHASILIEEMILHAQHTFVAFAGRMNPVVWNERVMAALDAALSRGVDIRLLVERECEPLTTGIMPASIQNHVWRIREDAATKLEGRGIFHCASGDGESFRIEMDRVQNSAVFAANNQQIASKVVGIFDALFEMGEPYIHAA